MASKDNKPYSTNTVSEDIWEKLATERSSITVSGESSVVNTHVVFVGDQGSGKSTLIQQFLKPSGTSKDTKPTIALEYSFARKNTSAGRYIANLWEVGGDFLESRYLDIPLTTQVFANSSAAIIVVLDLSKPHNVCVSALRSISSIKEILSRKSAELQASNVHILNSLRERQAAVFKDNSDKARIRPLDCHVILLANKAESTRTLSVNERRALFQVLRFIAHYFGASLLSVGQESSQKEALRSLLTSLCFGPTTTYKANLETSAEKGNVSVTRGQDSFDAILLGALKEGADPKYRLVNSENEVGQFLTSKGVAKDTWNRLTSHMAALFGEADPTVGASGGDEEIDNDGNAIASNSNPYPETEVDDMRAARDASLARYTQEAQRRQEMLAKANVLG